MSATKRSSFLVQNAMFASKTNFNVVSTGIFFSLSLVLYLFFSLLHPRASLHAISGTRQANSKRNRSKQTKSFCFLGLTEHVYSNFPFVTSVGNRCFEEKLVFIASKAIENCSLQDTTFVKSMISFPV